MSITKEMFLERLMENVVYEQNYQVSAQWFYQGRIIHGESINYTLRAKMSTLEHYSSVLKDMKQSPHKSRDWAVIIKTCSQLNLNTNKLKKIGKQL